MPRRFLTAAWRNLVMLNYAIDPAILEPFVPQGTELDPWLGQHFVSVVGFQFLGMRVRGIRIPFHGKFDEVNLRFYVRRRAHDEWRRGVVFVKEVVALAAITLGARWFYNENYITCPMSHEIKSPRAADGTPGAMEYRWIFGGKTNFVRAEYHGEPAPLVPGSEEEFIAEHYWGYTKQRDGSALEYQVEHPSWRVCRASAARLDCDVAAFYGREFTAVLQGPPSSAFVVDGSEIAVYQGEGIPISG